MTNVGYFKKLQLILSQLSLQKDVNLDDTCLNKLIDKITKIIRDEDISNSELKVWTEFLASIDEQTDEKVTTFAIQLFGVIGGSEKIFKEMLSQKNISPSLDKLCECILSNNMSVLSNVYSSLGQIVSHQTGLVWFLHTKLDTVQMAINTMKDGKSVFVISSVQSYLADLVESVFTFKSENNDKSGQLSHECGQKIITEIWRLVKTESKENKRSQGEMLLGLQMVKAVYIDKTISELTMETNDLNCLIGCLLSEDKTIHNYTVNILERWYEKDECQLRTEIEISVHKTVEELLEHGEVHNAFNIALHFYYRFKDVDCGLLERLSVLPLLVAVDEDCHDSLTSQMLSAMKTKSAYLKLLTSSISSTSHLKSQKREELIIKIIQILKTTVDLSSAVKVEEYKYLKGNNSVQTTILQTLTDYINDSTGRNILVPSALLVEICDGLLTLTEETQTSVQVLMVLFKAWVKLLQLLWSVLGETKPPELKGDNEFDTTRGSNCANGGSAEKLEKQLDKLACIVEKKMCDIQWEVRDSAVEFLGNVMKENDARQALTWMKSHNLHVSLWQCTKDQESYVRATALSAVGHMTQGKPQCLQEHILMDDITSKVCDIILTDSEAFPRRAAVDLMAQVYFLDDLSVESDQLILKTMCEAAVRDFDWDVQLKALQFWQHFIEFCLTEDYKTATPDYAQGLNSMCNSTNGRKAGSTGLSLIEESGILKVLTATLWDSDQSVQEKTLKILKNVIPKLQQLFSEANTQQLITFNGTKSESKANDSSVRLSLFLSEIENIDLGEKLADICQGSDEYIRHPESLLDDILVTLTDQDTENVIDCY